MEVLVISKLQQAGRIHSAALRDMPAVPRVGDKIDIFYEPIPTVTEVIWSPSKNRLLGLTVHAGHVDAVVFVE